MIKKVEVIPGCISCRNCENICPQVFKVDPTSKVITNNFDGLDSEILQAELSCPVNVIKVENSSKDIKIGFKQAKVREKNMLTDDVLEITFACDNFSFKPGQYISLQASDNLGKFSRSYSIAIASKNSFTLNIKLLNKGRGSRFLNKLKIGDKISFLGALGNFYLKNTQNKKVFIATGTGLAPMIAMIEACPKEIEKIVIFGVRFEKDIYYKEKLESFPNTKVIIRVSKPSENYKGETGRVTDDLDKIGKNDEVYICGNPEMVYAVKEGLIKNGHNLNLIYNESFTISRVYPGFWKDIIFNGNIPYVNLFSWIIIIFSLTIIPFSWFQNKLNDNLYGNYLFINNFMGFMFDLSWWSVVFVMAIRPLSDLLPKLGILKKLVSLRKAFGILSSSIIVVNLIGPMFLDFSKFISYFSSVKWGLYYPIISRISEITAIILLITSNNFSQKNLGIWWKRIQRSSYLYFICGGIIAAEYFPIKIYPSMIIVIILWILAQTRIKLWK
ncbi:MAG: FAD-binding oxidoreductase [Candidatus Gracilibacteria bacterium]|nr:FAD-binding oxidoreductase [Candidatus Gracilibacteria bacterium]